MNERRGRESKQRVQEHVKDSRVKERNDRRRNDKDEESGRGRRGRREPEVRMPRGKGRKKDNGILSCMNVDHEQSHLTNKEVLQISSF